MQSNTAKRAGRAGHTVAGTDKRTGQTARKKQYGKSDEELETMWERAYSKSNEELELIQNNNTRVHAISQNKNCELEKQNKDRLQAIKEANSSAAAKLRGTLTKHLDVEKGSKRKIKMLLQQP